MYFSIFLLGSTCYVSTAIQSIYTLESSSCETDPASQNAAFSSFIERYNRTYKPGSEEHSMRKDGFASYFSQVVRQNCNANKLWSARVNHFADRTSSELARYRGLYPDRKVQSKQLGFVDNPLVTQLPDAISYANLSAMQENAILDQGQCGSCWAAAAGVVLRAHSQLHATDTKFSVQELVSCTPNPRKCGGSGGCDGATGELAFEYVMKNGLRTEDEFPYLAEDMPCPARFSEGLNAGHSAASIGMKSWIRLPSNVATPLQRALVEKGPVAVSVAADVNWFMYEKGIMDACPQHSPIINHLVVLMSYGTSGDTKFWGIQNSWGAFWGELGHIRVLRGNDEQYCGWDNKPRDGVACEGEDDPIWVCGHCGILYDSVVPEFA